MDLVKIDIEDLEHIADTLRDKKAVSNKFSLDDILFNLRYGKSYSEIASQYANNSLVSIITRTISSIYDSEGSIAFVPSYAYYCYDALEDVSFPSCSSIGTYAFYSCSNLSKAFFSECSYVGSSAFYNCNLLEDISFPSCSYIGANAFERCWNLSNITFPACESINWRAFYSCSALQTASFPECLLIDGYAFSSCTSLYNVYLLKYDENNPSSICEIHPYAFENTPIAKSTASVGHLYVPSQLYSYYTNRYGSLFNFSSYSI